MNIKSLKLHHFRSHKNTELKFDKNFYMILGKLFNTNKSNGAGKTGLSLAIAYALYGNSLDEINNDNAIYNDENEMFVELKFELNNTNYIIKRQVTRGLSPVVYIKIGNKPQLKYGVKTAQEIINDILGADFSIYKNTSYFKQGDLNSFSSLTPKEAKDVVIRILQLDIYGEYENQAKIRMDEIDSAISRIKNEIYNLEKNIKDQQTNEGKEVITQLSLDNLIIKLDTLKSKKTEKEQIIKRIEDSLKQLDRDYIEIDKNKMKLKYQINDKENRIKKLESLSDDKNCPMCESELNKADIDKIIRILRQEIQPIIESHNELVDKLQSITDKKKEVKSTKVDKFDYEQAISETSYEIGKVKTELKRLQDEEEQINRLKDQLDQSNKELNKLEILSSRYSKLKMSFGKKGIQAFIIENVIPEIQATTNDILENLDTDIRIMIDSQKSLKKGGKAETLDINVITEFGERPYMNYSGGERTFIDFSLRIALAVILARRSKCKIQTLILDEVFGELDSINKGIISRALRYIAKKFDFKKILIISHAEELQDSFENIIRVIFDGKSSYIEKEIKNEESYQHIKSYERPTKII